MKCMEYDMCWTSRFIFLMLVFGKGQIYVCLCICLCHTPRPNKRQCRSEIWYIHTHTPVDHTHVPLEYNQNLFFDKSDSEGVGRG